MQRERCLHPKGLSCRNIVGCKRVLKANLYESDEWRLPRNSRGRQDVTVEHLLRMTGPRRHSPSMRRRICPSPLGGQRRWLIANLCKQRSMLRNVSNRICRSPSARARLRRCACRFSAAPADYSAARPSITVKFVDLQTPSEPVQTSVHVIERIDPECAAVPALASSRDIVRAALVLRRQNIQLPDCRLRTFLGFANSFKTGASQHESCKREPRTF